MDATEENLSCCTAATTASLASRLASLAVHYPATRAGGGGPADDKHASAHPSSTLPSASSTSSSSEEEEEEEGEGEEGEEEEGEVEVVELTEEQVLGVLDGLEPAWGVASRLFRSVAPVGSGSADPAASPALRVLPPSALEGLRARGFAVVDGLLGEETAADLRASVLAAAGAGALTDAASAGVEYRAAPGARSDAIAWLPGADPGSPPPHPALGGAGMGAVRRLLADIAADVGTAVRLALPPGACGEIQVALYPPGGRYVRHRDALPDDGGEDEDEAGVGGPGGLGLGQRRVTVVLYANPGWAPADGGKLRLWPPVGPGEEEDEEAAPLQAATANRPPAAAGPSSVVAEPTEAASDAATEPATSVAGWGQGGATTPRGVRPAATLLDASQLPPASPQLPPTTDSGGGTERTAEMGPEAAVDVAPLAGRVVLFMSGVVEHAVLPAAAKRVAVTGWLR